MVRYYHNSYPNIFYQPLRLAVVPSARFILNALVLILIVSIVTTSTRACIADTPHFHTFGRSPWCQSFVTLRGQAVTLFDMGSTSQFVFVLFFVLTLRE